MRGCRIRTCIEFVNAGVVVGNIAGAPAGVIRRRMVRNWGMRSRGMANASIVVGNIADAPAGVIRRRLMRSNGI